MRTDKSAEECIGRFDEPAPAPRVDVDERRVDVSHRDKVFFPELDFTKGDLVDYYDAISAVDAAVSEGSPARVDAVSRRHPRQVVLSARRARVRAGVDSPRDVVERRRRARSPLLHRRRRAVAALSRQSRHDSNSYLAQPRQRHGASGLVRARSRPQGRTVRIGHQRRQSHPRS